MKATKNKPVFYVILAGLALIGVSLPAHAQTPTDIVMQTRTEKHSLNWLIEKTRLILNNAQVTDLLTGEATIDTQPVFVLEEMTDQTEIFKLREVLARVFKTDLKTAHIRLRIPKVFYQLEKLLVDPKGLDVQDPKVLLALQVGIQGLTTRLTEGLAADVMLANPKTGTLESFLSAHIDPVYLRIPQDLPPLPFDVEFETLIEQGFRFSLKNYDTTKIPAYVENHKSQLKILSALSDEPVSTRHIKIHPVVVRLNHLSRSVDFESVKPIIQKRLDLMIGKILSLLGASLEKSLGPKLLKMVFSNNTRSDLMVSNDYIYTRYASSRFSKPAQDQFALGIRGDLCTTSGFKQFQESCVQHVEPYEPVRTLTDLEKQKGLDSITETLAQNRADLVVSIHEDYINRLLKTTIDADLWDEKLAEDHLSLGPKGVFTVFNQKTQKPEMFIDLYYSGDKGVERIFINDRRPIRFPLRMSTSISFVLKDKVPHMIIKTEKLLSDAQEIIQGIPEYELESRLVRLFRKKIAKMIIKMAQKLEGQVAIDLDFPIMKEVGLENTTYEVTPYGRLNWLFRI
jgi:hypothetical protein